MCAVLILGLTPSWNGVWNPGAGKARDFNAVSYCTDVAAEAQRVTQPVRIELELEHGTFDSRSRHLTGVLGAVQAAHCLPPAV